LRTITPSWPYHCIHGSDAAEALRYAHLAAEQAVGRAAYLEATNMVEAGLKLLNKLPEGPDRLRAELALRSIENMVAFVVYGGTSTQRERAVRRMCELGEEIGQGDQMLRGLITLSHFYFAQGESARGLELSTRCLELATTTQEAGLLTYARWTAGVLAMSCGKLREAVVNFEAGVRVIDRTNRSVSVWGVLYRSAFTGYLAQALPATNSATRRRPQVFVPCSTSLQLKCGPGPRAASIAAARHSRLTGRIGGIGATSGSAVGAATE
jgi:hypothetical protein